MRPTRRGRMGGHEFGGSGEDSFVAVVVTKLTGALLFILLLTMVIVVLIPRGVEGPAEAGPQVEPLRITLPDDLPDAIMDRPYTLALAASGGLGRYDWSVEGELPEGLAFDASTGRITGTPAGKERQPQVVTLVVEDGLSRVRQAARLTVVDPASLSAAPSVSTTLLNSGTLRDWLATGFGFLVLGCVWLAGMSAVGALERWSTRRSEPNRPGLRFHVYRGMLSLTTLGMGVALGMWMNG